MSDTISKSELVDYLNTQFANLPFGAVSAKVKEIYNEIQSGRFDTEVWISVEDRLPEQEGDYLIYRSSNYHDIASYEDGTWIGFGINGNLVEVVNVTHWMPLPEPPKGEDTE